MSARLLALIMLCVIGISPSLHVDAYDLVAQGDNVYYNETIDISEVVSWPDYTLVYCAHDEWGCEPDQIIEVEGNMHKYWLDPSVFTHYGTYWRWDGAWHRGENQVAFHYLPGKRPDINNLTDILTNETSTSNHGAAPAYGPYTWLITRGEDTEFTVLLNATDPARLWVFVPETDVYMDIPIANNESVYTVNFSAVDTRILSARTYKAYIQLPGENKAFDIYYEDTHYKSIYNEKRYPSEPLKNIDISNPTKQYDDFAASIPYYDDKIIQIKMVVAEPYVVIAHVSQEEDALYISGTSTYYEGTDIILKLDPENYPIKSDASDFTWATTIHGGYDSIRHFETALRFNWNDLSIGKHHIDIQKVGYGDAPISTYDFRRSDIFVMPTPTPKRVAILTNENYEQIKEKETPEANVAENATPVATPSVNATPTETPVPGLTQGIVENDMSEELVIFSNTTPTPTPVQTHDSNIKVPLSAWLSVLAMVSVVLLWRRRDG